MARGRDVTARHCRSRPGSRMVQFREVPRSSACSPLRGWLCVQGILSSSCQRALQRYVCASVFPECPSADQPGMDTIGSIGAFQPVCRSVCREVKAQRGLRVCSMTCAVAAHCLDAWDQTASDGSCRLRWLLRACAQAEMECGLTLSCGSLPVRDCTAAMEEGFFVLKDDQVHDIQRSIFTWGVSTIPAERGRF